MGLFLLVHCYVRRITNLRTFFLLQLLEFVQANGSICGRVRAHVLDPIRGSGSGAYAGGFIGFLGGDANVHISNSFARGSVNSNAAGSFIEPSVMIGTAEARAYSGGFVGLRHPTSRLTIENSYVTNNIESEATPSLFRFIAGRPYSHAGAFVGSGGISTIRGHSFRLGTQTLSVNGAVFRSGFTNTNGSARNLTTAQMQNQASFTGWDFNDRWAITPGVNGRFPTPRIFVPATGIARFGFEAYVPASYFPNGFARVHGQMEPISLVIESLNSIQEVVVGEQPLLANQFSYATGVFETEHLAFSGATFVDILPDFLATLGADIHSLVVLFEDGSIVEEYIHILEEYYFVEDMDLQIAEIWIGGVLVFSLEYGQLVDEEFFDNIADGTPYTIVFGDGQIWEGEIFGEQIG